MVRYDRQRVASTARGSTMAPVGHASRQSVQAPHWSSAGGSVSSGSVQMISDRNSQEPSSALIRQLFLPIQPIPARCA